MTAGMGVEWAWRAKNELLPPLTWSLEMGLGYSVESADDSSEFDRNESFLAFGLGIHYQFE